MKVNFERTIGPIALIAISVFMFIMDIVHFITRRTTYDFDQIYRWELSTFVPILLFFTIGIAFFIEVRGKERVAHLVSTTTSSLILVIGTIMYFVFDNYENAAAFTDALVMILLPALLVSVSFFRLRNQGKEILTDKMRNILIYVIMGLIVLTSIVAIVIIVQALRSTGY